MKNRMGNIYTVEIHNFITHIAKTNNKKSPNKFIKINNQLIYNSNLNRFARNIVVTNLHNYLIPYIKEQIPLTFTDYPYQISLEIHVPINYGDVSRRIDSLGIPYICWKEPKEDYVPKWDIGNLGELWLKVFEDSLQLAEVIENDSVGFINIHGPIIFKRVDTIEDRKLLFNIIKLNNKH